MFHVKHIIKFLIFQLFFILYCFSQEYNFDEFLRNYEFKIFSGEKEVGFINIKISSTSEGYQAEVNSYTDIPILFFLGGTNNKEIERYDKNLNPLDSLIVTMRKNNEFFTSVIISSSETGEYFCKFIRKRGQKEKLKEIKISFPIITAGNVIPFVNTDWDFEKEPKKIYNILDKDRFEVVKLKLNYLGEDDNFYKIKATLPSYLASFIIYLDKNKNIKYAEGLGLKVYGN
mgnify:CR=1 FL=1